MDKNIDKNMDKNKIVNDADASIFHWTTFNTIILIGIIVIIYV